MERIDILTPELNDCASFVVNTAVNSVVVTPPALSDKIFYSGNDGYKFEKGDNLIILSAGYFIPERFVLFGYQNAGINKNCTPQLFLQLKGSGGGTQVIWQFGSDGRLNLPFPNYEFSIGTFVDSIALGMTDATFSIVGTLPFPGDVDRLLISMVDVPAALNGLTFQLIPFVKVLHTLELTN